MNNDPNPENTSILSTSNTNITHTTLTILLNKVQSPNSNDTTIIPVQRELQFQATTTTRQPVLQRLSYTTSQTTQTQNLQMLYLLLRFILIHCLSIQLLEVFLDLHFKLFLPTHYRMLLPVQTLIIHKNFQLKIIQL